MAASLENGDGLIQNASFHARCSARMPDELVRLMLLTIDASGKERCFARVEWRSSPHPNLKAVCGEFRGLSAGRTHYHDPCLHRGLSLDEFFGVNDLPIAVPIDPEPETYRELLEIAAGLLHIENLRELEEPPWQPLLSPSIT